MHDQSVPEEFTHDTDKREIPFSPEAQGIWDRRPAPVPETDLQALMEAAPGDEPRPSREGSAALMDGLAGAIEQLPPKQAWVIDAHLWRGLTFAEIGVVLSVSRQQAHRIYEQALSRLRLLTTTQEDDDADG